MVQIIFDGDKEFDFGFSIVAEDELSTSREKQLEVRSSDLTQLQNDTSKKLKILYDMVMPLLNNLKKDPEKDYILWPDRVKKINEFIKKIDNLVKDEVIQ
jgi:hypothetical protein